MPIVSKELSPTIRIMDILDVVMKNRPGEDTERLNIAYVYAAQKHQGQLRQSGEPYLAHPLNVAYILASMNMDMDSIIAGMLHDTLEDTDATKEEVESLFGKEIAFLVEGLTKISKIEFKSREEKDAENFRKLLISILEDIRVIIIKLADRLHNMRTIGSLKLEKQERIAGETMEIYAPLAHRLGIAWIKWELEDLSFQVLYPDVYADLKQKVRYNRAERESYLEKVKGGVLDALEEESLKSSVDGRPKHFYSIYSKMRKKNATFDEIYDLLALRVLVDTPSHCYSVLGVLHHKFKPVPGRFKDYIAMPKPNHYQSLHTTVIGPEGHMVEFQIRTYEMHRIAEEGVAAHWKYKEGIPFDPRQDALFVWLRQVIDQKSTAPELVESLKEDVLPNQIYVFTPKGYLVELPVGSTPIDFAYAIHSEVGHRYVGAKVDGRIVQLKYPLQNGEKVEIMTSPTQEPRKAWLTSVKTTRAKSRIKAYIRKKESDKARERGLYLLEKEFKQKGASFKEIMEDKGQLAKIFDKLSLKDAEDMILAVGFGRVAVQKIVHTLYPEELPARVAFRKAPPPQDPFQIDGIDNVVMRLAKCCRPLPGDEVVGYISTGRGIVVHKKVCANVRDSVSDRIVPVVWKTGSTIAVNLLASTVSRPGLIHDITQVTTELKLNIAGYNASLIGGGRSEQRFSVDIPDQKTLNELLIRLARINGIRSIKVV